MPLRKSPVRTPALLAANRANALKCTGPRTPEGKARASMNSLKHGRHAVLLRETLVHAGQQEGEQLYQWLLGEICRSFEPRGTRGPGASRVDGPRSLVLGVAAAPQNETGMSFRI